LPSDGEAKNPQLFADPNGRLQGLDTVVGLPGSKKRKRGEDKPRSSPTMPEELDFFGDGVGNHELDSNVETDGKGRSIYLPMANKVEGENVPLQEEATVDMGEEECKRILKAHKLKITLLKDLEKPNGHVTSATAKKISKKHGKGRTSSAADTPAHGKKGHTPLYPEPLTSFLHIRSKYGISRRLANNISAQGYTIPTEVQLGALPLLLGSVQEPELLKTKAKSKTTKIDISKRPTVDLLTVAPTGSGKTLAFLIPIIHGLIQARRASLKGSCESEEGTSDHNQDVKAIIVAPTHELADQIVNEGRKLAIGTGIKITGMRKGMRIAKGDNPTDSGLQEDGDSDLTQSEDDGFQKEQDKSGIGPMVKADVLVSTPLMLLHAIRKTESSAAIPLSSIRYLVLDESDVLLDPLFRSQTMGIWNACVNPDLRVSLWSATMGSNIEELAGSTILTRQESFEIAGRSQLVRLVVGLKDSAIPNISHRLVYAATEAGKLLALRQLLHPSTTAADTGPSLRPPFLVFTQNIPRAIALHSELLYDIPLEAGGSSRIAVLHSDLSDRARSAIMARFRKGEIWILITTDLLSRGVDFRGINGVVNYDVPNSGAAYVHRVGRTGRAGRNGGVAVTFYTKEDIPYVKNVANIIATSEKQNGR
ncbi:MAG: RNA-dependent ATPase rok1, partial [Pleopsidium flavum]